MPIAAPDGPCADVLEGRVGELVEVAQPGDEERNGEQQRHERAESRDGDPPAPAGTLALDLEHDRQSAHDDDPRRDGA